MIQAYDKGVDFGRKGIDLYKNLPEHITNDPDFPKWEIDALGVHEYTVYSGPEEIRDYLSPHSGMKFIDLGCCLNLMFRGYDEWPSTYHGVDISKKTIQLLQEFTTGKELPIEALHCGSIHETPFDANYFDIGTCIGVLEYFEKDFVEKALIEAQRIIRPHGKLILDVPNIGTPTCRIMMLIEEHLGRPNKFNMSPQEFEDMLQNYFEINKIEKVDDGDMIQYFLSCKK